MTTLRERERGGEREERERERGKEGEGRGRRVLRKRERRVDEAGQTLSFR